MINLQLVPHSWQLREDVMLSIQNRPTPEHRGYNHLDKLKKLAEMLFSISEPGYGYRPCFCTCRRQLTLPSATGLIG